MVLLDTQQGVYRYAIPSNEASLSYGWSRTSACRRDTHSNHYVTGKQQKLCTQSTAFFTRAGVESTTVFARSSAQSTTILTRAESATLYDCTWPQSSTPDLAT